MTVLCECGAKYDLIEVHISQRDKDSIECAFCGKTIKRWSGSNIWLIKASSKPRQSSNNSTDTK